MFYNYAVKGYFCAILISNILGYLSFCRIGSWDPVKMLPYHFFMSTAETIYKRKKDLGVDQTRRRRRCSTSDRTMYIGTVLCIFTIAKQLGLCNGESCAISVYSFVECTN